jgi:transposase
VVTEQVPWSDGKSPITLTYRWFLAAWARRLSWSETARIFKTLWRSVFQAVQFAVYWGIANDPRENVESIGIDEIAWQKGHSYLTLVYQLDAGKRRLLYVVRDRAKESLEGFFRQMGRERCERIKYVVSDMWHNYLDVVKSQLPNVIHVLDRFHVMKKLNEAIDEVRRSEVREMSEAGYEPILKKSRWCLLKRPENLTDQQTVSLQTLLKYNLKTTRAWLCREDFQRFWVFC